MAVAFDATANASSLTAISFSWTHTPVGTPTCVGVALDYFVENVVITSPLYGAGTLVLGPTAIVGAFGSRASIYSLPNPESGAQTVSFTFASATVVLGTSNTVTGSDTTTAFSNTNTATGSSTAPSVTVTSAAGELVMDSLACTGGGTITVDSPQTERAQATLGGERYGCSTKDGAASVTMSWTRDTSAAWAICAASFKAGTSVSTTITFEDTASWTTVIQQA